MHMAEPAGHIALTVVLGSELHRLETFRGEYRSLMALICDKLFPDDFGECKGVGRCGTCHVYIGHPAGLCNRVANEESTLSKMPLVSDRSRLACQIPVDDRINGIQIEIVTENL
jgi:2Fe-2S ferredoxin